MRNSWGRCNIRFITWSIERGFNPCETSCLCTYRCWLATHSASVALQAFIVRPGRKSRSKDSQGKIKNTDYSLCLQQSDKQLPDILKTLWQEHCILYLLDLFLFLCSFSVVWIEKATNEGVETAYPTAEDTGLGGSDWAIMKRTEVQHDTHGFSFISTALTTQFANISIWSDIYQQLLLPRILKSPGLIINIIKRV